MTCWQDYLTEKETHELVFGIEVEIARLKARRETLRNRAKLRRHRAKD